MIPAHEFLVIFFVLLSPPENTEGWQQSWIGSQRRLMIRVVDHNAHLNSAHVLRNYFPSNACLPPLISPRVRRRTIPEGFRHMSSASV